MLEIRTCSSPEQKRELFDKASPEGDSWIVSDLQSKWHLQREWLARRGVLEQSSVLRAGELWKQLAFQLRPEMQILSVELAQTLIWNLVEPKRLTWLRSPQSVSVVLRQMQMWVSVFAHAEYKEVMAEWFSAHPESYVRWGHWFELCSELWEYFQENNLLLAPWLPGLLLNEDLSRLQWNKRLIFDLGAHISQVEGQLIQQLGSIIDVDVIYPQAPWVSLMPDTLKPYADMMGKKYVGQADWQPPVAEHLSFGRFSTQLAEVKDAVAQIRAWLESGLPAHSLAIVVPDVEDCWPVLKMYLEREGIPVNKSETSKLGGFIEMTRWMAHLRTQLKRVKSSDLEMSLFVGNDQPRLSVSEFRRLFTHVYDERDLERAENLFERSGEIQSGDSVEISEFLAWALGYWRDSITDRLESLISAVGQEVPNGLKFPADQWLNYLEGLLARREMVLKPADESGIWCVSLSSAHWLPLTHAVFMNLNEASLRTVERSPVSPADAQMILQDTGYGLGPSDNQQLEFELIWFLQKPWRQLRMTFASSDFQGNVLTPSRLWMWAAFLNGQFKKHPEAPGDTRFDEIQRLSLDEWKSFQKLSSQESESLTQGLQRDTDGLVSSWGRVDEMSLSPSGLGDFWSCPFVFAAKRRFRQGDDAALDLDMDYASRGQLLHAILEALTVEPRRFDWNDEELLQVIESARETKKIECGDKRLWPAIAAQHLRLSKLFLNLEKEWREQFSDSKTVGRELDIEGFWDMVRAGPTKEPQKIKFRGRIDRVDVDSQGRYALIDYKSSRGRLTSWKKWLDNHEVQLPFYAMLLEEGFSQLPAGDVVAANFFVVKDSDREIGYFVKEHDAELYDVEKKRQNYITEEQKTEMFQAMKTEINGALESILAGRLNPSPADLKSCAQCNWRKQCRAPHLN